MNSEEQSIALRQLKDSVLKLGEALDSSQRDAGPKVRQDVRARVALLHSAIQELSRVQRGARRKPLLTEEDLYNARMLHREVNAVVTGRAEISDLFACSEKVLMVLRRYILDMGRDAGFDVAPQESAEEALAEEADGLPGNPTTPFDDDEESQ